MEKNRISYLLALRCYTGFDRLDKKKRIPEPQALKDWKEFLEIRFMQPGIGGVPFVADIANIVKAKMTPKGLDLSDCQDTLELLANWCKAKCDEYAYKEEDIANHCMLAMAYNVPKISQAILAASDAAAPTRYTCHSNGRSSGSSGSSGSSSLCSGEETESTEAMDISSMEEYSPLLLSEREKAEELKAANDFEAAAIKEAETKKRKIDAELETTRTRCQKLRDRLLEQQ